MKTHPLLPVVLLTLILPLARATAQPEAETMTLSDPIGVAWEQELVHHDMTFDAGGFTGSPDVSVVHLGVGPVASQVSDIVRDPEDGSIRSLKVWFLADVPANGSAEYKLTPGRPATGMAGLKVEERDGVVEITTDAAGPIAMRMPIGTTEYTWPVPASDVPGPILGMTLPTGAQLEGGRFEVPFTVKRRSSTLTARGPLFAEIHHHYTFDTGEWDMRIRIINGCAGIVITEELDTGDAGVTAAEFDRFYTLPLSGGDFSPSRTFYTAGYLDEEYANILQGEIPHPDLGEAAGIRGNWFASKVYAHGRPLNQDDRLYSLIAYPCAQPRVGPLVRYEHPGGDSIGVIGLSPASWRNPLALRCEETADGHAVLRIPLQKYEQRWKIDGLETVSPNHTGTVRYIDPTTLRRRYAIMLSRAEDDVAAKLSSLFAMKRRLGYLPLDRIKDWHFGDDASNAAAGTADTTSPEAREAIDRVAARMQLAHMFGGAATYSMGFHYSFAKSVYPKLADALRKPETLTAEDAATLQRLTSFMAHDIHSEDRFPYGSGYHLNNPNMTIMAMEARAKASSLVPGNPHVTEWGQYTLGLMREYFYRYTMPSGAPFENPHYTLGVTLNWAADANRILMDAGIGDALDTPIVEKSMRFIMNWLTPPDPRFNGHRVVVPLGNCSYQSVPEAFTKNFVEYYQSRDRELAGQLQWFGNQTYPDDKKVNLVVDITPDLKSGWFKDYGVIFRHGFGTPYETYMHLLAGKCFGHYEAETDQMTYTIYAKGQPIHLSFGNGYFPMYNRPWLRNRISFDMKMEAMERDPITVEHASFSSHADYYRAARETTQLLPRSPEYPQLDDRNKWTPEESAGWGETVSFWDKPESMIPLVIWKRQMLFMKDSDPRGPNYFVLRDTFGGRPTVPTDLNLWFLANTMEKQGDVFHFDGQCEVDMDVFVHTPQVFEAHTDSYGHQQQPYGRLTGFDPEYHPDGKLWEQQLLLRIGQQAGDDYMVVLYPRLKDGDAPATMTRLADSVVRVETPASSDLIFLDSYPVTYSDATVTWEGMAGAVRTGTDGTITVVNSDGPCTATVAGKTVTGNGAFTVRLTPKPGIINQSEGAEVQIR